MPWRIGGGDAAVASSNSLCAASFRRRALHGRWSVDRFLPSFVGLRQADSADGVMRQMRLEVDHLVVERDGSEWVRGVSLSLKPVAFWARWRRWNGQSELVSAIAGLFAAKKSGQVVLAIGDDVTTQDVKAQRAQRGLALVPEDRHRHGLVLDMTLLKTLILGS